MKRPAICHVFGAGTPPVRKPAIRARDYVIAADGGYSYAKNAGIRTDVLIGDFDSLKQMPPRGKDSPAILRLPKEKELTDLLAALRYGLDKGFCRFHLYGAAGGRLDHTVASVQCLSYLLNHGARGYLFDRNTIITAMRGEIHLAPRRRGIISVFALGEHAQGVSLTGLKYELDNVCLRNDFPLGVSNEFTGLPARIKVESGALLVAYPYGTREMNDL